MTSLGSTARKGEWLVLQELWKRPWAWPSFACLLPCVTLQIKVDQLECSSKCHGAWAVSSKRKSQSSLPLNIVLTNKTQHIVHFPENETAPSSCMLHYMACRGTKATPTPTPTAPDPATPTRDGDDSSVVWNERHRYWMGHWHATRRWEWDHMKILCKKSKSWCMSQVSWSFILSLT